MRGNIDRRTAVAAVVLSTALALGAGACAPGSGGGGGDGDVTLRFSFWGTNERADRMQHAIDIFEEENPGITVEPDFVDWSGYWDRLATGVAGGDVPDVFMQEDRYIGEYARRDVLADLSGAVPTDDIDASLLSSGDIDGGLYGIATGSNVFAVIANPDVFEEAGVELPDDTTWTWEDYVEISDAITAGTPDGTYGTSDYSFSEVGFNVYTRQHGQSLFGEDGGLGYDDTLLTEWFQRSLDLQTSGGQPPADETVSLDLLDSPIAQGYAAMSLTWSAQLGQLSEASGSELVLLRLPGESELERPGMYFKPGMYVSQSASSEHPEEASAFVDFFVNDPRVGEIFLSELGLPGNAVVREAIMPELSETEQVAADFVVELADEIIDAPAPLPSGAGEAAAIMQRINSQVLFGQLSADEAAAQFRTEVEAAIG